MSLPRRKEFPAYSDGHLCSYTALEHKGLFVNLVYENLALKGGLMRMRAKCKSTESRINAKMPTSRVGNLRG
jgi:hypothetical protein